MRPEPVDRLPAIEILFLCTGNICRSPAAEALLRNRLHQSGRRDGDGQGAPTVAVRSAGILEGGQPASAHGVDVLSQRGIDASGHRSQAITTDLLRSADLILAMAREHVREAVVQASDVWPRTFTLKELVRRGDRVGARRAGESLEHWLAQVHAGRTTRELMGSSSDDDVRDPIGQPRRAYEQMVLELDGLVDRLVWLVWGMAGDTADEDHERERAS